MRLVVQRVKNTSVSVKKAIVGKINEGLFVLVGVKETDSEKEAEFLADKLIKLRIMSDSQGKMNLSVKDVKAGILVVSQFTLYADTSGGNRPSFVEAAEPQKAEKIYNYFLTVLRDKDVRVETGIFGKYMSIETVLDGPVTIILEK